MASNIKRVVVSGNLTRDPELRSTAGGTHVLSLAIAVNDRRKNPQSGEWEDYPNFVDCKMFGSRAESVSRCLSKGQKVCIEGKLRYSSWERDGQKHSKLEVVVDEIEFMAAKGQQQPQAPQAAPQAYYAPQQAPSPAYAPQPPMAAPAPAPQPCMAPQAAMQPLPLAQPAQVVQAAYADQYSEEIPF